MIVKCKVHQCPYNIAEDCTKPLLTIDENGMCGQLWFHGRQRGPYALEPVEDRFKEKPIIEEVNYEDFRRGDNSTDSSTLYTEDHGHGKEN